MNKIQLIEKNSDNTEFYDSHGKVWHRKHVIQLIKSKECSFYANKKGNRIEVIHNHDESDYLCVFRNARLGGSVKLTARNNVNTEFYDSHGNVWHRENVVQLLESGKGSFYANERINRIESIHNPDGSTYLRVAPKEALLNDANTNTHVVATQHKSRLFLVCAFLLGVGIAAAVILPSTVKCSNHPFVEVPSQVIADTSIMQNNKDFSVEIKSSASHVYVLSGMLTYLTDGPNSHGKLEYINFLPLLASSYNNTNQNPADPNWEWENKIVDLAGWEATDTDLQSDLTTIMTANNTVTFTYFFTLSTQHDFSSANTWNLAGTIKVLFTL